MPVGDLLRYTFLTLLGLVLLAFGLKWWGKHKTEKQIVQELQSLTSSTSSFEQFYAADAQKTLFLTVYQMHLGETKLGLSSRDLLDKVFETRKKGGMFDHSDPSNSYYDRNPAEDLIRTALQRNYANSKRLGLFSETLGLEALARGEAPQIKTGPATGKIVHVGFIISPEVSPGIEKLIPNFVIRPPDTEAAEPTEFDVAQAKLLASSLYSADLLEDKARERIIKHYDNLGKEAEPEDVDEK